MKKLTTLLLFILIVNFVFVSTQSIIDGFDLKWTAKNDEVDFVYSSAVNASDNVYLAFAFSTDTTMGNDCVCLCKIVNNVPSVEHYYNSGKSRPSLLDGSRPSVGITNPIVKVENEVMTCSFTRAKRFAGLTNYFDISSNKYNILHARGAIISGNF
jgi:hypothetical protein